MNCPECGKPMTRFEDEPDVGIAAGFACTDLDCDTYIYDSEIEDDQRL